MTFEILRPKDLPAAVLLADTDNIIIDQGAGGVKRIPVAVLRSIFAEAGAFAANLTGEAEPEGQVHGIPGQVYIRIAEGIREWWIKASGQGTNTGWELSVKTQ